MLGQLPKTLTVGGVEYDVRTDFRSVLRIISAYLDEELSKEEKIYVTLKQMYRDFDSIPTDHYTEAFEKAVWFMNCGETNDSDEKKPKIMDWEQDEQLLFPAVNKVAGVEVRLVDYLHWWTFIGYFQGITSDDTYGYILALRNKKASRKKFEKHEREFWEKNRSVCEIKSRETESGSPEDALRKLYEELAKGG